MTAAPEPSLEEVERPLRRARLRALAAAWGLLGGVLALATAVGLVCFAAGAWGGPGVGLAALLGGLLGAALGGGWLARDARARRFERAQLLTLAGHGPAVLPLLKELSASEPAAARQDTLCYLTARAYEAQGATKLALAYYRDYRKRFPAGAWALEVKTHAADLRRLERARRGLVVAELPQSALRCPYCREDLQLGKEPSQECPGCGTAAHPDCVAEHGGCMVFGCAQAVHQAPRSQPA